MRVSVLEVKSEWRGSDGDRESFDEAIGFVVERRERKGREKG